MTRQRGRTYLHKALRAVSWSVRLVVMTTTALVVLAVLNVLLHTYLHVCPLHMAHFERRAIVPVVYGLPIGGEMFAKAARGEIVLGGCVVGPLAGVCPYCRWPAAFTHESPAN
jgi:hypothetical protein